MKNIEEFGCVAGGPDNTGALQAAVDSEEGLLIVPAKDYFFSFPVTISRPLRFVGESLRAKLIGHDPAQDLFRVATSEPVGFGNLRLSSIEPKTAGKAIAFDPGAGVQNDFSEIRHVIFERQIEAVDFARAAYWRMSGCHFVWNAAGGTLVRIRNLTTPDAGDQILDSNQFYGGDGVTHVRYEGGGGLRAIGNKFLMGANGIDLCFQPGAVSGILMVSDNSFDGQTSTAFSLTNTETSSLTSFAITGNVFSGSPANTLIYAQQTAGMGGIGRTAISGNVFLRHSGSNPLVQIVSGGDYIITANTFSGSGGNAGLVIGAEVTNSVVGPNMFNGVTLVNNSSSTKVY